MQKHNAVQTVCVVNAVLVCPVKLLGIMGQFNPSLLSIQTLSNCLSVMGCWEAGANLSLSWVRGRVRVYPWQVNQSQG